MVLANITTSLILPVVTKPSQFDSVNNYAALINGQEGIYSFGGIHPASNDCQKELEIIKGLGLLGIKLHPDYQGTFIDDVAYLNIITYALNLDLIVSIHAGIDIGLPTPVHCPPSRSLKMLETVLARTTTKAPSIILAHTGGFGQWDEVERLLVGKNVYFDLSYSLCMLPDDQLIRMIRKHGSKKILFATDSPWGGQKETLDYFYTLALTKEEQEDILYRNACRLLHLETPSKPAT
jgi:predicted TIM-barrel fold metal-dependent hydrolase